MSDITADFIKATNKIYAKVGAILTNLQIIEGDVKLIREQSITNAHEPHSDANTGNSQGNPERATTSSRDTPKRRQSQGNKESGNGENDSGLKRFGKRWKKSIRKPVIQLEIAAIVGLGIYTCETRRTNNLTQEALNIQYSQSRAFIQITGSNFLKGGIEDVKKAGAFYVEMQDVGKTAASKVHGEFVVEFPLASQEPSFNLSSVNATALTHSPLYPGAPPEPIQLIFVANYGTVMQIPPSIMDELTLGSRYAVVFGRIEYEDAFGEWWTQFCGWRHFIPVSNPPHLVGFPASRCVDFNIEGGIPKKKE